VSAPSPGEADGSLRTLSRAVSLLRHLANNPDQPIRLALLSTATGLHKATAHRILAALATEGMVEATGNGYVLGPQSWLIGRAADNRFDLLPRATASLRRIADETGDVAIVSILTGYEARCIGREEGDYPILPTSIRVGSVRPLGCVAHALALLAALPDAEVTRAIAASAATRAAQFPSITDALLHSRVATTRQTGVAVIEGDITTGQTALAVAVRDPWGKPLAALCCMAITDRLTQDRRPAVAALLQEEATRLESRLRPQ
jgi:DNA-binding IclR family transcriptional regulator